ncbi:CNNM family magnesium/cobalt transport protein CorC [Celerinatantimonas sp. MCCC 1A17872]|uniref:CNNM family magnesium/cobalt transport protein CorC n=1 Tax=Celerinatantimonas sp. MCCC 1A17872 TaxID=3177514 RepID=UPI0038C77775
MSDENPHSGSGSTKSWLDKVGQWLQGEPQNKQQLVDVIQDANERDLIDQSTTEMIEGVLEVANLRVRDIMIPRSQMITINITDTVEQFLPIIIHAGHSRFPVINEDKDHIEGILLAKDLLLYGFGQHDHKLELSEILRPAVVVPESKRLDKLLKEFRSERYHMAIVVDEFGGVSGLVTIEDILELIVGDIEDEFVKAQEMRQNIRRINSSTFAVSALTSIEDFNEAFHAQLADEEVDTIGGLVTHAFGHLPARGEKITIDGYLFKVSSADRRRVIQLQVTIPELVKHSSVDG